MSASFSTSRRVEFRDTDAAGIMHFSTYFNRMEEAEHEFFRALGTSVVAPVDAYDPTVGEIGWPRVAAECHYSDSARFEDELQVELRVKRIGSSSVTYGFRFSVSRREIAHGSVTAVCCRMIPGQPPESIPIPQPLRQQLMDYLQP
jgi:acyl-CoA thioester hydrolase